MGSILAFLKSAYDQKEKIILGLLVVAFAGVAFYQFRKGNSDANSGNGKNPRLLDDWKPAPTRDPEPYDAQPLNNQYPLGLYVNLMDKDIFDKPRTERGTDKKEKVAEWAKIKVKSVFDPTQSGAYIAIIGVDNRSRIVKEGQQFEGYTVQRIDGVRSCLTIEKGDTNEEKEFCKEE